MNIGPINLEEEVFVIAEIGNNHEGDLGLAKELIQLAAQSGAHAVKFQTIVPDKLVSSDQAERIAQLSRFQFSQDEFRELKDLAQKQNVIFLSTPFDVGSVAFLNDLVPAFKVASSDNTFLPLLQAVAQTKKPILLSTGLATNKEISSSVNFIKNIWNDLGIKQDIVLMHCVTAYPTDDAEANLSAIAGLKDFGVTIGYSDHTLGIDAAVLAVALGARVIEKHFTKDKKFSSFRDHQLSADPTEFAEMVRRIKKAQILMGHKGQEISPSEQDMILKVRRSIVAGRPLAKGKVLEMSDLSWVRPGDGLAPGHESMLLGKSLKKAIRQGEKILEGDVQ